MQDKCSHSNGRQEVKGDLEEVYSHSAETVSFLRSPVPRGAFEKGGWGSGGRIKEVYIKLFFPLTT